MPAVDEIIHSRLLNIEKRIHRHKKKPAPTLPIYGSASGGGGGGTNYGFFLNISRHDHAAASGNSILYIPASSGFPQPWSIAAAGVGPSSALFGPDYNDVTGAAHAISVNDAAWHHIDITMNFITSYAGVGIWFGHTFYKCETVITVDGTLADDITFDMADPPLGETFDTFASIALRSGAGSFYVDNLNVNGTSHNFDDGLLGPFSQDVPNAWSAASIGGHQCMFGDSTIGGDLYLDFGATSSVHLQFDGYFPV